MLSPGRHLMAPLNTIQASSLLRICTPLRVQTFVHSERKNYRIGGLVLGMCVPWWTMMDQWKWLVNVDEERVAKWTRLYMFWDSIISRLPHYRRLNGLALMSIGCWERLYSLLEEVYPPLDEPIRRGEGVALVLLNDAITSWQAAGKQWKSWSARMISASFRIGEKPRDILHVVSCYALHGALAEL